MTVRALARQAVRRLLAGACACAGRRWSVSVSRELGGASFRAELGS
jgi:hypothetical protein